MAKKAIKLTDAEQVTNYITGLEHPMKAEIERLRQIIKQANPLLNERIKWSAPSYYYMQDIVTFGPVQRAPDKIMLVFHHPFIVSITSELLEGDYKDRRLAYFKSMEEVEAGKAELQRIINAHIEEINKTGSGN